MIPTNDRRIKRRPVPELEAVRTEYEPILDDMVRNSGPLIPDPNWLGAEDTSKPAESYDKQKALDFALSDQHYLTRVSKMAQLMHAWIGGTDLPSQATVSNYRHFLEDCDALNLWAANLGGGNHRALPLNRADLGSLMDLNLLYAFSTSARQKVTTILEVGGGYGRLAEAMFNVFGRTIRYVLVDAVPASLYYARKYLTCACPDARIGSYYDTGTEHFDLSRFDIAIVPAWHFERLNTLSYDLCINIESFQEMNQNHVDYYLSLFDSVSVEGATIYVSNAHDYYFRGQFRYPTNWQKLYCANTPRSWRPDHPTEIFRKMSKDYAAENRAFDALHKYRLWLESDAAEFVNRNGCKRLALPILRRAARSLSDRTRSVLRRMQP